MAVTCSRSLGRCNSISDSGHWFKRWLLVLFLACVTGPAAAKNACMTCYHVGMKKQAKSIHYTVRGVPREVDRVLRLRAAQRGESLNQVILHELTAVTVGRQVRADFSDLVGHWTADPGFDEVLAAQRQINWDKWK